MDVIFIGWFWFSLSPHSGTCGSASVCSGGIWTRKFEESDFGCCDDVHLRLARVFEAEESQEETKR